MKRNVFNVAKECGAFSKYRLIAIFLTFFVLFSSGGAQAQQCDQIHFNFVHYEPCHFRLTYDNSTECYTQIRLALSQGTFATYSVNAPAGFIVQEISPSELWITHSGGFLPLGFQGPLIFTLAPNLVTSVSVAYLNDCPPGVGCEIFPSPVLESCPIIADACIIGTKYRECSPLPYTNQPVIPDWTIYLEDFEGSVLDSTITDSGGAYSFCDLAPGTYIVREAQLAGWTPSLPPSGQSQVNLSQSETEVRNFGNCPPCSCDKMQMTVQQTADNIDICCYKVTLNNSGQYCFNSINVEVDPGTVLSNVIAALPGWTATLVNPQLAVLVPPGSVIPVGVTVPLTFCISGGSNHNIHLTTSYSNHMASYLCVKDVSFHCGGASGGCACPNGGVAGPNLVVNGNFSTTGGFTSNYTAHTGLLVLMEGEYWLGNNASLINGGYQPCKDHTGGGNMMVVNGATTTSTPRVWCETVAVLPNMNYQFGAWVSSMTSASPAHLQLYINNVSVGTGFFAPGTTCNWEQYCEYWFSGTNTSITLCLVDLNTSSAGNDFALDDITFVKCSPPAPSCTCQQGATLNFSTGGNNYPLSCGGQQTAFPCPTGPVTITGNFGCVDPNGAPCQPPSPIDWALVGPANTIVAQGTILGGAPWTLPFTLADLSASGPYALYMSTLCAGQADSCHCQARWYQECVQCACGPNAFDMEIRFGGALNQPVHCDEVVTIPVNGFFVFYPSFHCTGTNCGPTKVDWKLTGPSGFTTQTGSAPVTPAIPAFSIAPLAPANFTLPGTYMLQMWGYCGGDTCPCKVTFCLPPTSPIVDDTVICRTHASAYIPLFKCPAACGITQVRWFVKPCSAANWPTTPYQVSSGPNCSDLLILPYKYPNEACLQVYAEITLDGRCCSTTLMTSNIATITLCNPISCSITNPNQPGYCQTVTPQALTVVPAGTNCNYTVQWYYQGQAIPGATALTYQPPTLNFQVNPISKCYYDHVYSVIVTGICGPSTCSTTIRVYDPNAPVGVLDMYPFEPQPFCPGEDATLVYTPECAGDPQMWSWSSSTTSGTSGFSPIPGWGNMDPKINTNKLFHTTWYKVTKQNGVCPIDEVVYQIVVKDQLVISNFTATPDPCADTYVILKVSFTPSPITGAGCSYVVDWYKDGNLIHTDIASSSPVVYTYNGPNIPGVYYAVVHDNCCPQSATTTAIVVDPTCVPVISGPCFRCGNELVTMNGEMVLPPQDPCPNTSGCSYQWYQIMQTAPGVWTWVPIFGGTGTSISVASAGHFIFESNCNGCIRHDQHDVAQCASTGTGCVFVDATEVNLDPQTKVAIHPNPTSGTMTLQITPGPLHDGKVDIVALDGRVLLSESLPDQTSTHSVALDRLPAGLYFVRVYTGDVLIWTDKIVKGE